MAHAFNPGTQEAEEVGFVSLRAASGLQNSGTAKVTQRNPVLVNKNKSKIILCACGIRVWPCVWPMCGGQKLALWSWIEPRFPGLHSTPHTSMF